MNNTNSGEAATKTTRRNGQLMSCEPCRRSKQRCDHGLPHCMRCKRRGQAAEAKCHYHPAPMTRGARHASPRQSARLSGREAERSASVQQTQLQSPRSQTDIDRGTSFVGMDNVLPPLLELPADEPLAKRTYTAVTRTGIASPAFTATPAMLAGGLNILETIRDSPLALGRVIQSWYTEYGEEACQGPIIKASWRAVEETILPELRADSSPSAMSLLCESMFKCTSQPLRWPVSPANGAIEQALSVDGVVRWDVVGIYCALSGFVIAPMKEGTDSIVFSSERWGPDRKSAMERALDTCTQCYSICEGMGQINDLTMWMLIIATMLATWCYGDDSYQAWRLMGDSASVTTALGVYRAAQDEPLLPVYLQELRKRAVVAVHETDKGLATFVGRPPRLNRHYLGLGLPLDIPDSVLLGPPEDLTLAIARLDSNGWNTDGIFRNISRIRSVMILLTIREEALELSLGSQVEGTVLKSRELLAKSATAWVALPSFVKYEQSAWATMPPKTVMMLLSLRLEGLYTDFILHKLIVNHDHSDRSTLIETSHLILSLVLSSLSQRIVLTTYRIDLEWTMIYYAMPCASVLILELLRQTEQPHQPIAVSRSTLIQDLSVLISCCDWLTEPDQQNYGLCKRAQSIFSRSLDRILNPAPTQPTVFSTQRDLPANHDYESAVPSSSALQENQHMLIDEPEWMAWLETCNLQADPWLDILADSGEGPSIGFQSGDVQNGSAEL